MFIPLLLCVAAASAACPADSRPRCTSAESIAAGTFSGDTWVPSSECFVAVPSLDEMRRILRGSWLLMCGGSNTHVTFQTILGQLAPHAWEVRCAPPESVTAKDVGKSVKLSSCFCLEPTTCAQGSLAGRWHLAAHE
jgi:hypothetical protein